MSMPLRGKVADARATGPKLLKKALIVVQFSPVLTIADRTGAGVAPFQEAIRGEYPNLSLDMEQLLRLDFQPDVGLRPLVTEVPVWRMWDSAKHWRVSLTQETLSLEVSGPAYTSWADFSDRICRLLRNVSDRFSPAEFQRTGARFVNAEVLDGPKDPRLICAPELVSITGDENLLSSNLVWRFTVDEGELILQSGVTQAATSYDPQVLEPVSERQWYLDIDIVKVETAKFDAEHIGDAVTGQVRRAHAMYRWAIPMTKGVS